ncbi:MAG: MobF family relaxase, partial [Gammaproteobacteria bacterium]
MLSTSIVKNVSDAGHYYAAKDNYYTIEEGIEQSEWFGKGSSRFNLTGSIDPIKFSTLLKGELPNGEIIGKKIDDKFIHRAGWDLTFSAPKSVSIMALLAEDKRLIIAHRNAVNVALSEIERGCSEARIKNKNIISYSLTKNIIAALFHHDLSRAEDPQLHTHSVIMNLTQRHDGKWRSMASKLGRYDKETQGEVHGFIERVRNNKRYYGKLYETELAYQVQKLGYEIIIDEKTGVFQIQGVSNEVIEYFSKRRNKIKMYMEENGLVGSKAAEFATLHDREKKTKSDRAVLLAKWLEGSRGFGFNGELLIKQAEERLITKNDEPILYVEHKSVKIIQSIIDSVIQFKTIFSVEELISEASIIAINQKSNIKELLQAVDSLIEKGDLLSLENEQGKSYLMSKKTLDDEKKIKEILSQDSVVSIQLKKIEKYLDKYSSKNEEYSALITAFSQKKHVLVDGHSTKEVISKAAIEISKQENLHLAVVSPNQMTSKEFSLGLKDSQTSMWEKFKALFVDTAISHYSTIQFLNRTDGKIPDILLIEKSHLLSAKEQAQLLEWGQNKNTKMFFFSEKNLLLSQKKGVDTNYLIQHGIRTVSLGEKVNSIRDDIAKTDLQTIFKKISSNVVEVPEHEDRAYAMASHFARLKDHNKVYLVAHNKIQVSQLNQIAHDQLKAEGKLKNFISVNVLIPQFIPEHRQNVATIYSIGDVVRFSGDKTKSSQSEYLKIVGHDKKQNELLLKRSNSEIIRWKSELSIEVFKEEKREWAVGERLQSHRSMKYAGVVKGEYFTVAAIRGDTVKLVRDKGRPVYIDISKPYQKHFDYGYAATSHQLAHMKAKHFIADLTANSFGTDQRRFFQLAAQPEHVTLYTDNANKLFDAINQKSGDKLSAHDILQSSTDIKNHLTAFYQVLQQAIQKPDENPITLSQKAVNAVDYAIRHLSERNAGFTHKDLLEVAMNHAIGKVNRQQLLQAVGAMETAGIILRGTGNNGVLWTTQEAIKLENEIIALTQKDQGTLSPIASDSLVQKYCEPTLLHAEQIAAIKAIVQSRDRVLAIQGRAGTGKTTMMASLSDVLTAKEIWQEEGYQVKGIAPTHKAVKELKERGIPATTIDRFLLDMRQIKIEKSDQLSKTILIVDEASMVSNRKMRDVLSTVHNFNFRQVIPTGDNPQLSAIEAGKPHHLIQQILDDKVIRLEDIRRQKNPVLKEAVSVIYKMDVAKTFSHLGNSIIEIKDEKEGIKNEDKIKQENHPVKNAENLSYQKRVKEIAKDYVNLLEQKEDVQIITPSHEDRKAVNNEVRQQLEGKGYLTGHNHSFPILVSKDMTAVERSDTKNFKAGQIVRFTSSAGNNLKAGDYFTIKEVDSKLNLLTLHRMGEKTEEVIWRIPFSSKRINNKIEVFKKEERHLKIGDKIVWSRTDR